MNDWTTIDTKELTVLRERVIVLERRLTMVLRIMRDETEALCCCETDGDVCTWQCTHCEAYERAKTVARGE